MNLLLILIILTCLLVVHPITHIFATVGVQHSAFTVHFVILEMSLVLVAVSRDKEVATALTESQSRRRKFIYEKERVKIAELRMAEKRLNRSCKVKGRKERIK